MSGHPVQTQIRLLLGNQFDQGLHCLLFHLYVLRHYSMVEPLCSIFRVLFFLSKLMGVQNNKDYYNIFSSVYSGIIAYPMMLYR